jgi:HSP20 family molecular chaperone IbpA
MARGTATGIRLQPEGARPEIISSTGLADLMDSIHQAISKRAYEIFERRGRQDGHEVEDWMQAEEELARKIPTQINDTGTHITVRAKLGEFTAAETKLGFEPRRIILWANKVSPDRSAQLLQIIDVPTEIDSKGAAALLKDGELSLALPKVNRAPGTRPTEAAGYSSVMEIVSRKSSSGTLQ